MSKTEQHLKDAFAGESQANRKYLAFAAQADKDGHPAVARLFRAAAHAETVHAHAHLRVLGGIRDTAANLREAIGGETHEFEKMYPGMIADAEAEGNAAAARSFRFANAVEKIHAALYQKALDEAREERGHRVLGLRRLRQHRRGRAARDLPDLRGQARRLHEGRLSAAAGRVATGVGRAPAAADLEHPQGDRRPRPALPARAHRRRARRTTRRTSCCCRRSTTARAAPGTTARRAARRRPSGCRTGRSSRTSACAAGGATATRCSAATRSPRRATST